MTIQDPKYLVLLHVAVNAIVDGYYRDAILSCYSSLERFWNFYVDVIAHAHGVSEQEMILFRKRVRLSERELGSFYAVHLLEKLTPAPEVPERIVSIRNDVAHKGLIPDREAAIRYGNMILEYVRPVLAGLKLSKQQALTEVFARHAISADAQARGSDLAKEGWPYLGNTRIPSFGKLLEPLGEDLGNDIRWEAVRVKEERERWELYQSS